MDKLRIGFIGAGKVGVTLGAYIQSKAIYVAGYASRSLHSAQTASELTATKVFLNIEKLAQTCNMIFITTHDDEITKVWKELKQYDLNNKIICHTSGSLSSGVFDGISACGAYGYSIHPMYAFSEKNGNIAGIDKCYFTIEGNGEHIGEVTDFVEKLGNKSLVIDADKKTLYHLANVLVSNLILALLNIGSDCMQMCGISAENSMQALMPLIIANINNIAKKGFVSSLTGPVERNDIETISKHLDVLPLEYGSIYSELSMRLVKLSQQKYPERDCSMMYRQLNKYLNDNLKKGEI
ncbi:MAG: Rossmann-like and DUF2520 domain-containing protein [Eubacteriales bacterium]